MLILGGELLNPSNSFSIYLQFLNTFTIQNHNELQYHTFEHSSHSHKMPSGRFNNKFAECQYS